MSRARLMAYVDDISSNWEKVIAESVFKYAGSTYKSLVALEDVSNADLAKEFDKYMYLSNSLAKSALLTSSRATSDL